MAQVPEAALNWIVGGDTGLPALGIWAHMVGARTMVFHEHPQDARELAQCLRLLDAVPEWHSRLPEMARYNRGWQSLVPAWEELVATLRIELDAGWGCRLSAPRTTAFLRSLLAEAAA